ncbi:PorV/PorQ family protein [bacterium]|jgi:hypothetical protein|nr:hypothetical protein [Gemmatimonadota bacterium]MCH2659589.1 PorV/PorQ family protein [bacterium]|tara:strand:- start:1883 stop:2932 length:1050 start_codon:yes stop_codon:yes gene_type:complete
MRKLTTLILMGLCLGLLPDRAQATPESRAAVLFLLIEPGARAIGMGETYVAIADDATASYFNPAALAGQSRKKVNFTHSKWLPGLADDLSYEFLAYSTPVEGWGNIGVNVALLNLGEQIRTDERGNTQGTFRSYDMALSAAYGADIGDNMSAGIGLKFIRSNLADQGAGIERGKGVGNSFAADIGLLWKMTPEISFGAALRNLGPKIAYIDASQADPLPQHIVLGTAYELMDTQYHDVLLSFDLYKPLIADGSFLGNLVKAWADEGMGDELREMDLHVGGEYKYGLSARQDEAFFALRAGYSWDSDGELKTPTFGVGLKYNRFQVDVAYITGEDTPMQDNTRFSLNLIF